MDIQQIKIEKKKLESDIKEAIDAFENKTRTIVSNISFSKLDISTCDKPNKHLNKIELELDL